MGRNAKAAERNADGGSGTDESDSEQEATTSAILIFIILQSVT